MNAGLKGVGRRHALRRWFAHDAAKWNEFRRRYFAELRDRGEALRPIVEAVELGNVTLLYSARDTEHNNAVALKGYLEGLRIGTARHRTR